MNLGDLVSDAAFGMNGLVTEVINDDLGFYQVLYDDGVLRVSSIARLELLERNKKEVKPSADTGRL